jgi:signal transduction histidine kinase
MIRHVHRRGVDFKLLSITRPPSRRSPGHRRGREGGDDLSPDELSTFLARELHDGVAQTLSVMLLELETFRRDSHGRVGALKQIEVLEELTRGALADLRGLLGELRSLQRQERDLVVLLRAAMVERQERNQSVQFRLHLSPEWPERIDSGVATHLFRIATEAIDNATHHGRPKTVEVALTVEGESAVVTIRDNGSGIKKPQDLALGPGFGIMGISERAHLIGGAVSVQPGAQDNGTTVQVMVPLAKCRGEERTD